MSAIGNVLWFLMGGAVMGIGWWIVGCAAFVTVIGIPWGRACFVLGQFAFLPFGKEAISRKDLTRREDIGTGPLGQVGNVLWFLFAGFWLALGHAAAAVFCFSTIIGIPFSIQHLKLAGLALAPIGKTIVVKEVAQLVREESASQTLRRLRTGSRPLP